MIDRPVPGMLSRAHPGGLKGASIGLDETAKRAWAARMSPRLRAWATQTLDACGRPDGKRAQVQCLLDAFRKKVPYVSDPKAVEFIAKPEQLLCLDHGDLCIPGSDCEEMAMTMCALCLCIGIDAWIVGQSNRQPSNVPTHVYFGFLDDLGEKVRADATTPYPVGKVAPFLKEWWIDPAAGFHETGMGDFVALSDGFLADDGHPQPVQKLWLGAYGGLFSEDD